MNEYYAGIIIALILGIAIREYAKMKYHSLSEVSKLRANVDDVVDRVTKMEKDRLRDRVNRLENHNNLDIFG